MRDLIIFVDGENRKKIVYTNLEDEIVYRGDVEDVSFEQYKTYCERAEDYLRKHYDNPVVQKVKFVEPLADNDIKELEKIFWNELGTQEDYFKEYKELSLGAFIRSIVSCDQEAINKKFSKFLSRGDLNPNQQQFILQIINYVKANGYIEKRAIVNDPQFTRFGGIVDVFGDDASELVKIVDDLNKVVMM